VGAASAGVAVGLVTGTAVGAAATASAGAIGAGAGGDAAAAVGAGAVAAGADAVVATTVGLAAGAGELATVAVLPAGGVLPATRGLNTCACAAPVPTMNRPAIATGAQRRRQRDTDIRFTSCHTVAGQIHLASATG
jgi:hypothetical protein